MHYNYCPKCGMKLKDKMAGDDGKVPFCEQCNQYWFDAKDLLMHGFIGFASKADFRLSGEVDSAAWVPALKAPETMFPDRPGDAMHPIYRQYLKMTGLSDGVAGSVKIY